MKFRLVDRIREWQAFDHIAGAKTVSFEEYSLKDAFGGDAALPETLLLESFLQLGNWLILLSTDFQQMGMLVRLDRVSFVGSLRPGQTVELTVRMSRQRDDGYEFHGEGRVAGQLIISGEGCLAAPLLADSLVNPDDLRVLYSEIHQP